MKNKLLILSAVLLLGLTTPMIASCNKGGGGGDQPEVDTPSISFDVSTKDMIVGDIALLKARVKNPTETDTVVYSSNKPNVVSIDEYGYVEALNTGSAEIRATYGKVAAKCTINVTLGDYTPTILFKSIHTDEVNVATNSKIDISAKIFFNFKEYDFTPNYTLTDEEVGEIDGSDFIANKVGETTLTVTGEFLGHDATPISLKINVVNNIVISMEEEGGGVEDNSVILFTYGSYSGQIFKQEYTPIFKVYENGEIVPTAIVNITCDTKGDLIDYNTSTHKVAVPANPVSGETAYVVTYTKGSDVYSKTFSIYVNKPVVDYDGAAYDVDKYNSDLDAATIFSGFTNKNLVKVTSEDGTVEYEVDQTTHKAIELPSLSSLEERVVTQKFIIYNDVFGFKVRVNVYDKIIRTFDDLKLFNMKDTSTIITGDYYLANDIDGSGQALPHHDRTMGHGYNEYGEVGFRGVFDGRGHTLKDFKVGEGGIFGNLGKDSVIKNVAITNIDFVSEVDHDDTPIIAPYTNGATIENVYVYGTKIPGRWNNGFVFCNVMSNCKISHCLFNCNVDPDTVTVESYGALANMCGERTSISSKDIFSDTYVVSKLWATIDYREEEKKPGSAYVVDAAGFYDGKYTNYTYKNLNHDKTIDEMKAKEYDFSSFNEYWEVVNHELKWKGAN